MPSVTSVQRVILTVLTSIVFWNVENFLDPVHGNPEALGEEKHWTYKRFMTKCNMISKAVLAMSDSLGNPPVAVGLAEVENRWCVQTLIRETSLRKWGYKVVHYDSPDRRGIDCALIYRGENPYRTSAHCLRDSCSNVIPTRSILLAEFPYADIFVVHLPSKLGPGSGVKRSLVYKEVGRLCDSLRVLGHKKIIVMGDFNEPPSETPSWALGLLKEILPAEPGSIKFNGRWELIDRCLVSGELEDCSVNVWNSSFLSTEDKKYGGTKPLRTFNGPRYLGGVSDHYPIIITVPCSD